MSKTAQDHNGRDIHQRPERVVRGSLSSVYRSGYDRTPGCLPCDEHGLWLYRNGEEDGAADRNLARILALEVAR